MKGNTIVIKLGTSSICDEKTHEPLIANLSLLVETCVKLRRSGHRVVIVSSGGIGMGLRRMDLARRPKKLAAVQAIAAVGQCRLIALWDELFKQLRQPVAQILLTKNDIADRTQYLNAANTLGELLAMGVIPIVNENDTISVSEIKFGDNDTLSAITAGMVNADYLFLMTDVECLYTANPRTHPDAEPIEVVVDIAELKERADVSEAGSGVGTGGMRTKLIAAELATSAGCTTVIAHSSVPTNIFRIVEYINNIPRHTRFLPPPPSHRVRDRQFWLLNGLTAHGRIYIDDGAARALTRTEKAGLLPAGVRGVEGGFQRMECVDVVAQWREEVIGRALVNYSAHEIDKIKGISLKKSEGGIEAILGYADAEYVAFRDNLAILPVVRERRAEGRGN
ncbi:glutamate 5-kinase [Saitoella complicata NRRL Y-17804]|uniref:glutamate 5-kinase n=1 Tax=Saitoella complicata (strain BCRC 22490 / CBS 7301 / JCM 7358 / NBRC 10748 / NRRL Y-17804) TaxID=698492 RepID=UPI000867D65F|nr:glutamate 5-kinase [Saitoella complicata NRRL Y-17804]ODQ53050.1 glutamate 5-kinase [Saitoella complicata NRRL Y-17804]